MLNYYSYYSIGGYKDMYLGNSDSGEECTYYLPLLPVWKKRADENNDSELAERVKLLEPLPAIKLLSQTDSYGFPEDANNIVTHGGYRLILRTSNSGCRILAVSGIDNGASVPFLMLVTGQSSEDKKLMAKLFSYIAANMESSKAKLTTLFEYDKDKNGYCFHLSEFTKWIKQVTDVASPFITSRGKQFNLEDSNRDYIIKAEGIDEKNVISMQQLNKPRTVFISSDKGEDETLVKKILSRKEYFLAAVAIAIIVLVIITIAICKQG